MIHWRNVGFWPGLTLGAFVGLAFGLGTLMHDRHSRRCPGYPPPAHIPAKGISEPSQLVTPRTSSADPWPAPSACDCPNTLQDDTTTARALRLARDADSTFEGFLQERVLPSYRRTLGSCCGPVIKFEAIAQPLFPNDVDEESFSRRTDIVPTTAGRTFSRNPIPLSRFYASILDLARMPAGAWDMGFSREKAAALREFDKGSRASDEGPEKYMRSSPNPRDWSTNDGYWSTFRTDYDLGRPSTDSAASKPRAQLSFEYCIVGIDRPWFNEAFFRAHRRWIMPQLTQGQFSAGQDLGPVPVAMVVVRNVTIATADRTPALPRNGTIALSSLTLLSGPWTTEGTRLFNRTPQLVGWVCTSLPPIPPATAPDAAISSPPPARVVSHLRTPRSGSSLSTPAIT